MRIPSFPPSGLCHQFYPSCKFYPFFQQCNWQIKIRSSEKVPGKSRPLKSMKNQPLTTCITLSPLICYLFPPVTCQYSWQILSLMIGLKNIRKILENEINGSSCVLWQLFSFICRLFWSILKVAWLCACTQGLLRAPGKHRVSTRISRARVICPRKFVGGNNARASFGKWRADLWD